MCDFGFFLGVKRSERTQLVYNKLYLVGLGEAECLGVRMISAENVPSVVGKLRKKDNVHILSKRYDPVFSIFVIIETFTRSPCRYRKREEKLAHLYRDWDLGMRQGVPGGYSDSDLRKW